MATATLPAAPTEVRITVMRRAGGADVADEAVDRGEVALRAGDFIARRQVAALCLEHAELAHVAADRGLRDVETIAA